MNLSALVCLETRSPVDFSEIAVDPTSVGEDKPHPASGFPNVHWTFSLYQLSYTPSPLQFYQTPLKIAIFYEKKQC